MSLQGNRTMRPRDPVGLSGLPIQSTVDLIGSSMWRGHQRKWDMRIIRLPLLLAIMCLASLPLGAGLSHAFHDGGVASCNGCHTMHNSQNGEPINPDSPYGSPMLLLHDSSTDVCLSCHASALGTVLGQDPLNPPPELGAGNFTFLYEDNINDAPDGDINMIPGHHAGHNVPTESWGLVADPEYTVAPGGTFPSDQLTCTSCHDPHGNESFRMLRGVGPVGDTGYLFAYPAPQAEGIDVTTGSGESRTNHTAYQGGWTRWCANCHGFFHATHISGFEHPQDHELEGEQAQSYNAYDGPDSPYGGDYATAYIPELPIEDPAITRTSTFGATRSSVVMCMTCHRAHATSAPNAMRWDLTVLLLSSDGSVSGSFAIPDPYDHPDQRALCVKCHYDEAHDHGWDRPCMECHRHLED